LYHKTKAPVKVYCYKTLLVLYYITKKPVLLPVFMSLDLNVLLHLKFGLFIVLYSAYKVKHNPQEATVVKLCQTHTHVLLKLSCE
jgi:hypothetical protein